MYLIEFLPRDSYAKRGICRRRVSVRLCVCVCVCVCVCEVVLANISIHGCLPRLDLLRLVVHAYKHAKV